MSLVGGCQIDVDAGEQGENESLHQHHKAAEQHHRQGNDKRHQSKENRQNEMVDRHIEHEANRERDGPHAQGNDFHREDERGQVPDRAGQMLDVAHALFLQAVNIEDEKETESF